MIIVTFEDQWQVSVSPLVSRTHLMLFSLHLQSPKTNIFVTVAGEQYHRFFDNFHCSQRDEIILGAE